MRTRLRRLVRAATATWVCVLALVLAGCADADPAGEGPRAQPAAADPDTDADADLDDGLPIPVSAVVVVRSGGVAGAEETYRVDATTTDGADVLGLAAALPSDIAADESAEPPCCDVFSYDVIVRYANGDSRRLTTWDGADGPVYELAMTVVGVIGPTPNIPPPPT